MAGIQRDHRIDFFRGLALFVMFWDHALIMAKIEFAPFFITPAFTQFSDALEVFVFLSGFVFGLVYFRVLEREGVRAMWRKAVHRCRQIYGRHMLTVGAALVMASVVFFATGTKLLEVDSFFEAPLSVIGSAFTLSYLPMLLGILPMYIAVLLIMPLYLTLLRRNVWLPFAISFGLYLFAQFMPDIVPPRYQPMFSSDGRWVFNPLAWQFFFFMGTLFGTKRGPGAVRPKRRWSWVAVAVVVLLLTPVVKGYWYINVYEDGAVGEVMAMEDERPLKERLQERLGVTDEAIYNGEVEGYFPMTDKRTAEPLRLVHFFICLYLIAALLPAGMTFWNRSVAQPFIVCGRHSLEVFCLTVVLNYAQGLYAAVLGAGPVFMVVSCGIGFVLLTKFAQHRERKKQAARVVVTKPVAEPEPAPAEAA
jgi:hypothetical protein